MSVAESQDTAEVGTSDDPRMPSACPNYADALIASICSQLCYHQEAVICGRGRQWISDVHGG
jgi:hypothetical protein